MDSTSLATYTKASLCALVLGTWACVDIPAEEAPSTC
jgi:hypothetical protein